MYSQYFHWSQYYELRFRGYQNKFFFWKSAGPMAECSGVSEKGWNVLVIDLFSYRRNSQSAEDSLIEVSLSFDYSKLFE